MGSACSSEPKKRRGGMNNVQELRSFLSEKIKECPFGNINVAIQSQLEAEFISGNYDNPVVFIKSKNFSKEFTDLYQLCFSKCLPILGNLIDDKKDKNLIFYRSVVFLMSSLSDDSRKKETAKKVFLFSYDSREDKFDLIRLKNSIRDLSELCLQILIYIGLIRSKISDQELSSIMNDEFYRVDGRYYKSDLDDCFINTYKMVIRKNMEQLKSTWMNFIMAPFTEYQKNEENKSGGQKGYSRMNSNSGLKEIPEDIKEKLIKNISFLFDNNCLFDGLFGNMNCFGDQETKDNMNK